MRRALAIMLGLMACRPGEPRPSGGPPASAATLTDDAGRSVTVQVPARRIVSLAPSLTELVFALGGGSRLVGRTTWCKYPPAALTVPVVGDGLSPNVEAIASRTPDLVLLYRSPLTESAARQLAALGIPALILRHDRLADVGRTARLLGPLVGSPAAGDSIGRIFDSIAANPAPPVRARVAFVAWDDPPIVLGGGSYLTEVARLAGAENVFGDLTAASATVSLETIVARNPDWIVVLDDSGGDSVRVPHAVFPAPAGRPQWDVVPAVRNRRFLVLPGALFGRPTPATPRAVAALRQGLEAAR